MFYTVHENSGAAKVQPRRSFTISRYSSVDAPMAARTHVIIHDGISDNVRAAADLVDRRVSDGYFSKYILEDSYFLGRSFKSFKDVVTAVESPWEEGLKRVEQMVDKLRSVDLPMPVSIRRRPSWREDEPGDFNLDRCLVGQPFWRTPTPRPVGGPQIVSMLCQINAAGYVSPVEMMWRGAACVAMASILEEAGYSCEIQAFSYSTRAYTNGDDLLQSCWVKRAGDPLDVSCLVNATAAWFRRTVGFVGYGLGKGVTPDGGFGYQSVAPEEIVKYMAADARAAWQIKEVWTEEAAVKVARECLEKLCSKDDDAPEAVGGRLHTEWRP
jgi:hypothetical protein